MINTQLARLMALFRVLLLSLALIPAVSSAQVNQLNDIQFSELPGGRVQLRLTFSDLPPEPTGYTIEQPARIVMDFAGVESALPEKKYSLGIGSARSAVVVSSEDRTRLIVNLDQLPVYTSERKGNQVIMEIGADSATTASVAAAPVTPSHDQGLNLGGQKQFRAAGDVAIRNVDFRRGEAGEGKLIVSLTDPAVNIDVERTRGKIMLTFLGADLPESLRQRLDVTDFATPVKTITVDYDGRNSVISVEPSGSDYDYLAYQADGEYVLSVKPLTVAEIREKQKEFQFTGEKLSLNFQDIEVRSVLQLIADFTDLNLVASDTVSGRITLRLDGVPWDQALDLILKAKGLDKRQEGNVIMVAPAAEIAERERQELETRKQLEELAPLHTEYIHVRYADARELFTLFSGQQQGGGFNQGNFAGGRQDDDQRSILSSRGSAIVDERTNTIILTDTEEKIAQFRELIEAIDIPIRQVMIEARIVNANSDFQRDFGVQWNYVESHNIDDDKIGIGSGTQDSGTVTGNGSGPSVSSPVSTHGAPLVDLGLTESAGSIAYAILKDNFYLGLELSALEDVGKAEIVSQPKVMTGDKQEATIQSGVEIPYLEATSSGAASVTFREAVLQLSVTPQITPDNNIIMDLQIDQNSVGELYTDLATGSEIPAINVNTLSTKVLVSNGETLVLGGIFESQVIEGETKVPLLGDIPYLGHLFKRSTRQNDKRELLIFITPRIMEDEFFFSK
ncbi:type IV pilus secretin PilQ [Microbulbifer thermotolerans]|uniref:Fimbrial protein n=1 Tax=Microbulbifer thermotolerans TaxID=252514 RepID=A0A143HI15_MICTH|nr:type IV pilus secretin PilQ [Microbulbifer thermotolerans]AMX01359.1 fimbrial protein [Microbulbifer thermotolerans]MCX2795518.1 type IV pilus secretin PilQ [Microbulbifer thermotolerans]MCX2800231.1 type IV pilus secretin PilQ [Microbulbifer thermotolerans]MCX2831832.1 type IV pilus secretin PilQ [Microbulbifer thermotolerans]MCX2835688.1 type IV pilus secretin PilQ [Microbulbifer thermotolerans]